MATHGKARENTIKALRNRQPFARHGFSMQAFASDTSLRGRLPQEWRDRYNQDMERGIIYTVVSFQTPIAWVNSDSIIVIPDVHYSMTTTHHQNLCKVYLS